MERLGDSGALSGRLLMAGGAAALVLFTAFAAVTSNGGVAAAVVPALVALVVVAVIRLPLRYTAGALLFATLLFHNPGGVPHGGAWRGPLYGIGEVLFNNLRLLLRVDFLRFSTLELLIALVGCVALLRWLGPKRPAAGEIAPPALPVKFLVVLSLAAVVVVMAWGLARGGDFRQMLWQTRQLGWMPLLVLLFSAAFRTAEDVRLVGRLIVAATLLRAIDGLYFYFAHVLPRGLDLPYILTHEDSILFSVTLVILALRVLELPSKRTLAFGLGAATLLLPALVLNNRRLAYVTLLWVLVASFVLMRPSLRRAVLKLLLVASPLVVAYVAVGWSSSHAFFAPIASLRSVEDTANRSNQTRDDENFNLVETLRGNPVLGTGFGHPYVEVRRGDSIAAFMENYRYIPHNSVLGLLSQGGLVGFVLIWLFLPVVVFLATWAYRFARAPDDRVAALTAVAAVIAYFVQAYGDMGVVGWMGAMLVASATAVVARLATRTGAYPVLPAAPR